METKTVRKRKTVASTTRTRKVVAKPLAEIPAPPVPEAPAPVVEQFLVNMPVGSKFDVLSSPSNPRHTLGRGPFLLTGKTSDYATVLNEQGGAGYTYNTYSIKVKPVDFKIDFSKLPISHKVTSTGSDPEIFVGNESGRVMPAFTFLKPQERGNFYTPYWDGFQAEFGIEHGSCHGYGCDRIRSGLQAVLKYARDVDATAKLLPQTVIPVDTEFLKILPPEHAALGCNPSDNAYGDQGEPVQDATELPWRFAGGHLHFAFSLDASRRAAAVKWIDLVAALPSVAIFEAFENPIRRRYYGKAGEYRNKEYGFEYRTLSNAWLYGPEMMHMVWQMARGATSYALYEDSYSSIAPEEEVRSIINNNDASSARKFVKKNQAFFNRITGQMWGVYGTALFNHLVQNGVESAFPNYQNIARNWHLEPGQSWQVHSNNTKAVFAIAARNFAATGNKNAESTTY